MCQSSLTWCAQIISNEISPHRALDLVLKVGLIAKFSEQQQPPLDKKLGWLAKEKTKNMARHFSDDEKLHLESKNSVILQIQGLLHQRGSVLCA